MMMEKKAQNHQNIAKRISINPAHLLIFCHHLLLNYLFLWVTKKKKGFIWHPVANISVYVDYNEKKKKELLITFSQPECWHRNTSTAGQQHNSTVGKKKDLLWQLQRRIRFNKIWPSFFLVHTQFAILLRFSKILGKLTEFLFKILIGFLKDFRFVWRFSERFPWDPERSFLCDFLSIATVLSFVGILWGSFGILWDSWETRNTDSNHFHFTSFVATVNCQFIASGVIFSSLHEVNTLLPNCNWSVNAKSWIQHIMHNDIMQCNKQRTWKITRGQVNKNA